MQGVSTRLALRIREEQQGELNDYESEESEYEDYCDDEEGYDDDDAGDGDGGDEDDSSIRLQNDLARAAFGDLAKGQSSRRISSRAPPHELDLEEAKLLEVLQRRLFPSPGVATQQQLQPGSVRSSHDTHRQPKSKQQAQDQQQQLIYSLGPTVDPSISPEKVGKMVHRFRLQEEKRARKLRMKREEAESKEKTGFTYAPALNRKSLKLTDRIPKFLDRQKKLQFLRKQQQDWHRQQQEMERTRDRALELEAHVRTPCICSRGNTTTSSGCAVVLDASPSSSPSRLGGHNRPPLSSVPPGQAHTRSCLRFMEMCGKMNKSFAIQRRKDQMTRSIDDMMAYHEEKKQRQQARAEIARAQEATHATFTPQINPRSEQIYAEMVRSGRLQAELSERMAMQRRATPSVPSSSFQPVISRRSKALLQKKKRLIRSGDKHEFGDVDDNNNDDVFFRLYKQQPLRGDLHHYHHQDHQHSSPGKRNPGVAESTPAMAKQGDQPPPVEWNVIAFDHAKHGFILQNFDLKVSIA